MHGSRMVRSAAAAGMVALLLLGFESLTMAAATQPTAVTAIQLLFKRDPRVVDPFRGIGEWSEQSTYAGALAQDTVEVRAAGVGRTGRPVRINPEWTASDPAMVTIAPSQGDDVKITVHKDGQSTVRLSYQGLSKELEIHAAHSGNFLLFDIAPPQAAKGAVSAAIDPSLKTSKEQVSYAAGMRLAKTLRAQSQDVDPDLIAKAMKDVLGGGPTLMNDAQVQMALMGVEMQLNVTEALLERRKIAEHNKQEGEAFLAANKAKEGVMTLPDGLQYKIVKAGDGKKPTAADVAICQYKGSLIDGTVFDDSHHRKDGGPVHFPLKAVIKGWQEALAMMPAGSRWQVFVPPELGYGDHGAPHARIPPNATLIFDVELLAVKGPNEPAQSPKAVANAQSPDVAATMKKIAETLKQDKSP